MAQALGGTYGLPHGAMNALCLPPALEFNRALVPEEVRASARRSAATRSSASRALARLGGFERLRDFGVPEADLPARRRSRRASGPATSRTRVLPRPPRSSSCCAIW